MKNIERFINGGRDDSHPEYFTRWAGCVGVPRRNRISLGVSHYGQLEYNFTSLHIYPRKLDAEISVIFASILPHTNPYY